METENTTTINRNRETPHNFILLGGMVSDSLACFERYRTQKYEKLLKTMETETTTTINARSDEGNVYSPTSGDAVQSLGEVNLPGNKTRKCYDCVFFNYEKDMVLILISSGMLRQVNITSCL